MRGTIGMKRRWMMVMAARCALVVATLFTAALAAPVSTAAAAGPPVIERFHFEGGPFVDEDLSRDCGFEVRASFSVDVTIRSFPDGSRLIETFGGQNHLIFLIFTANGNTVTFIEVVHEVGRISPNGTLTYLQSGRSWLEGLIGHWVIDPNLPPSDFILVAGRSIDHQEVCTRRAA
jgi:hypothetical protein